MFSLTVKSIRANKARFFLTGVAVMLGVAFMAGTFVLTDTIKKSYDDISANVYRDTDAVVRSAQQTDSGDQGAQRPAARSARRCSPPCAPVHGVQAAEAQQLGIAVVVGHDGTLLDANQNRSVPVAFGVAGHARRSTRWSSSPVTHRARPDEIVIDRASADEGRTSPSARRCTCQPGRLAASTASPASPPTAAPTARPAPRSSRSRRETAAEVIGTPGRYDAIQVVAAPGVSQDAARRQPAGRAARPDVEVITGAQATAEAGKATGTSLQFVNMFLMTFAIVALVVGSFVIYNTFSITVAQRTKETALLRAIGAKRRQVMRSIRFEALLTGVFASAVGVVVGIATRAGSAVGAVGVRPRAAVRRRRRSQPRTIVVSMVIGVVVTLRRGVAAGSPGREGRADRGAAGDRRRRVGALEAPRRARRRSSAGRCGCSSPRACRAPAPGRSVSVRSACSSASPCSAR